MDDRLDPARLRALSVAGSSTRVWEAGEGEPLVLVHGGAFGSLYSLDAWSLNLEPLAASFHVVAFDKLGQGHSDNPPAEADYRFEVLLRHTLALLDSLALGPAHLVGHSMGALLVAAVALERPELARTVVMVDSNTLAPDDPRFPRRAFYLDLARRTPPGPPTRETVRMEPDAQAFSRDQVSDDFVGRLLEIARLPRHAEAVAAMAAVSEEVWMPSLEQARREALAAIGQHGFAVPALVAWAADDVSAPLPLAWALYERIAARTAQAELHVVARSGHYLFREQPQAFERLLRGFCAGRG